jgi:hypothetical protein
LTFDVAVITPISSRRRDPPLLEVSNPEQVFTLHTAKRGKRRTPAAKKIASTGGGKTRRARGDLGAAYGGQRTSHYERPSRDGNAASVRGVRFQTPKSQEGRPQKRADTTQIKGATLIWGPLVLSVHGIQKRPPTDYLPYAFRPF